MKRLVVGVLGLVFLPTPLAALALVCVCALVAWDAPGRTWVRRIGLALVVVTAGNAAVLTSLAVLRVTCVPRCLLAAELVLLLLWQRWRPAREPVATATQADLWAVAVGALTFVVLAAPFFGASVGRTMALMSRTTDGATHVQLVTVISRYQGYVQLQHPQGISSGVDHYPTGWHGSLWVLSDLLWGANPTSGQLVRLVAFGAVATYAALAAACTWMALNLTDARRFKPSPALLLIPVVLLGFGLFQLQLGSYSQTAALTALLLLVGARRWGDPSVRELIVVGSAAVVAMQSWYLYAPLVLVALLPTVFGLRRRPTVLAASLVLVAPFCLYPLVTGPAASHLDLPGPVLLPSNVRVVALLLALGVATFWALRRARARPAGALAITASAALAFTGLLAVMQGDLSGPIPYYAAKYLLTALVLGCVLACGLLLTLSRPLLVVTSVALALGALSTSSDAWPPSINPHTRFVDARTLQAMYDRSSAREASHHQAMVMQGCDRVWDRVASKWAPDTSLTWTPELADALVGYSLAPRGDVSMLRTYLSDPAVAGLDVYVRQPCDTQAITALERDPKVQVIRVP